MKRTIRITLALILRGAIIWGMIGFSFIPIADGISHLVQSLKSPVTEEYVSLSSPSVLIRAVIYFSFGCAVLGIIYTFLLTYHWHGGERIKGPGDELLGRSQTAAEFFSFMPLLICGTILGAIALPLSMRTNSLDEWIYVVFVGGAMGLGGGIVLPALSTGIVDRF